MRTKRIGVKLAANSMVKGIGLVLFADFTFTVSKRAWVVTVTDIAGGTVDESNRILLGEGLSSGAHISSTSSSIFNELANSRLLGQSLIRQPNFLLNEPLSALDLNYQYGVMDLSAKEIMRRNIITELVVHYINTVLEHAERVLILKKGRSVFQGEPTEVNMPNSV